MSTTGADATTGSSAPPGTTTGAHAGPAGPESGARSDTIVTGPDASAAGPVVPAAHRDRVPERGAIADGAVHVVGLLGGAPVGAAAVAALATAAVVVGAPDQLDAASGCLPVGARRVPLGPGLGGLAVLDGAEAGPAGPGTVCVLASGDPGFFGIVRALRARLGGDRLRVHPAPSSVALAFARLGRPWDDAVVVSAHARALDTVVPAVRAATTAAVLTGPDNPPEALGKALVATGCGRRRVAVCSRLAEPGEEVVTTDLDGLAAGTFDARSVVVLDTPAPAGGDRPTTWGRDTAVFAHRASMITKPEVRAAVLGRLDLPATGVLWDLGAGSGSVAVEAALTAPGLRVIAVERRADDAARVRANAALHGALVEVVEDDALDVVAHLPRPDRVFVGGGGLAVLDAALAALAPSGRAVATFAAADRAVQAYRRLGHLVQVGVDRAEELPDGGIRFVADNPVFVAWGTTAPRGLTPDPARDGTDPPPARAGTPAGRVVVGVGCSSTATAAAARELAAAALAEVGATLADVDAVATIDRRADHPAVAGLGPPVIAFAATELAGVTVPHPSEAVARAVGTPSVAEAAALRAAGTGAHLSRTKLASGDVTVAVAVSPGAAAPPPGGAGRLSVVGLGPGGAGHRTAAAVEAVRAADVVVGYGPYVDRCEDLLRPDQTVLRSGMGHEAARATEALARARAGARVAIVSGGDPGVYAMASVTLELAAELAPDLPVTVVPGVTAGQAAAALAGAPLAHDHAVISLSDRLIPWDRIEARLRAAAAADLAVALYNPRSVGRTGHLARARAVLGEHRPPSTPVVVVADATRPGEDLTTTTLGGLDVTSVTMSSIVLVGSSATAVLGDRVVTRRHHPRPGIASGPPEQEREP